MGKKHMVRLNPYLIKDIADRRAKGMKVQELAEELGFNPITYSNWKREAKMLEKRVLNGENIFTDNLSATKRKYQVNLLNLLNEIREAEKRHLKAVEEEFEDFLNKEVRQNENGKDN